MLWARSYWCSESISYKNVGMFSNRGILYFGRDDDAATASWNMFSEAVRTYKPELPRGFGWNSDHPGVNCAYAPLWFIAATSAAFATVPWLPRRFSLRTLLIATTLLAVVLGLAVAMRSAPRGGLFNARCAAMSGLTDDRINEYRIKLLTVPAHLDQLAADAQAIVTDPPIVDELHELLNDMRRKVEDKIDVRM